METVTLRNKQYKVLFPDLFRPHTPAEAAAFDASVKELGIRVPAFVDEEGGIIDGKHRMKKAEELSIPCPLIVLKDLSKGEKKQIASEINFSRRMLTPSEMKERKEKRLEDVAKLRGQKKSMRQIGEALGVSQETIRQDLESLEKRGEVDPDQKVEGRDGIERPAKQTPKEKDPDPGLSTVDSPKPDEAPKGPPPVVDRLGREIPKKLRDVMADTFHAGTAITLDRMAKEAKSALKWSKYLGAEVVADLKVLADKFYAAKPDRICETCEGKGCPECNTAGYKAGGKK